ncbi:MAG: fibronectin type III domain-containing protein [Thermoplasmatota archaeon]
MASTDASGNGPALSEDMSFKTLAQPDEKPPVISNVRVGGVTDRLAVVSWETDEPADSVVEWGTDPSYGLWASDPPFSTVHSVVLQSLRPLTEYHLRVQSTDVAGNGPTVSADVAFWTAGNPDTAPPVISGIRVERVSSTSATVSWRTDEPSSSSVEYGPSTAYGTLLSSGLSVVNHSILLSGLEPGRTYHFRVSSTDPTGNRAAPSADQMFRTPAMELPTTTVSTGFPWWLAALAIAALIAVLLLFRRRRGGQPGEAETPGTEDADVLQMDEAPGGPAERLRPSLSSPERLHGPREGFGEAPGVLRGDGEGHPHEPAAELP